MTDKEHRHLPKLKEELAEGRITRRDFYDIRPCLDYQRRQPINLQVILLAFG